MLINGMFQPFVVSGEKGLRKSLGCRLKNRLARHAAEHRVDPLRPLGSQTPYFLR